MIIAGRAAYQTAVNRRPVNLTLTRITQEDDGAGGISETMEEIPVTVRLSIPVKRETILTDAGLIIRKNVAIMATWKADIRTGDRFTHDGILYEIKSTVADRIGDTVLGYQGEAEAVPA